MDALFPVNAEEERFCRHIADLVNAYMRFTGFLTEREQFLAKFTAEKLNSDFALWGGYEDAQRKMFVPHNLDRLDFPISAVTFTFRKSDMLSHRDFLGALMSLGIKRDQIGDILVSEGKASVFSSNTVSGLILNEVVKVGRIGVKSSYETSPLNFKAKFEERKETVSSLRTDALTAAFCCVSREKAANLVKSGAVSVNGIRCEQPSKIINDGDKLTIKGFGKFIFVGAGNLTKKGRLHISFKKYK